MLKCRPRGQVFSAQWTIVTVKVFKISMRSFGAFKIINNLVSQNAWSYSKTDGNLASAGKYSMYIG